MSRSYWYEVAGGWNFAYDERDEFPENKGHVADFAVWSKPLTPKQVALLRFGIRPLTVACIFDDLEVEWYPLDGITKEEPDG